MILSISDGYNISTTTKTPLLLYDQILNLFFKKILKTSRFLLIIFEKSLKKTLSTR